MWAVKVHMDMDDRHRVGRIMTINWAKLKRVDLHLLSASCRYYHINTSNNKARVCHTSLVVDIIFDLQRVSNDSRSGVNAQSSASVLP